MIKVTLTNEILKRISQIDENRFFLNTIELPSVTKNRLRKNSKKKSSYASNKIEGNPLTEQQANEAIDSDPHKHFLKPEQEIRNYFLALNLLEEKLKKKECFSKKMILEVQAIVEKGASKEKIGLRGPMPPGVLFAVYDSETGRPEYIPPEYTDIPALLDELVEYVNTTDDHPLIVAAVVHYQLVTIHPFEDGNGRILVKNKALLSLKDFNLKERLSDLAQAGITSFKIEGRLKNMSYVKNIVRDYSLALDRIVALSDGLFRRASFGRAEGGFTPCPDKTFNRGYTQLFIDGRRGKWSTFDSAKGMGEEVGTVSFISPGKDMLRIRPDESGKKRGSSGLKLNNGDGFSFVSRSSEVTGFRADVCNGLEIKCKPVPELFLGAKIYRNTDTAFEKKIETDTPSRYINVSVNIRITHTGNGFSVYVEAESEDGRTVAGTYGQGSQAAENTERMEAIFTGQMSKNTGHYRFSVKSLAYDCGQLPLMPVSSINGIRRKIADALDAMDCKARPLLNRTDRINTEHPLPVPDIIPYKANVSNRITRQIYTNAGASRIEPAFEISHLKEAELMRTKYCIRYELGLCRRLTKESGPSKDLFLLNNGQRFILHFDCSRCEMTVRMDTHGSRK